MILSQKSMIWRGITERIVILPPSFPPCLPPSIQITLQSSPPARLPRGDIRGGTDLRPWIHYGSDPIPSLKCPVACCSAVSLTKWSGIRPERLTVIKHDTGDTPGLKPVLLRVSEELLNFCEQSHKWINTCFVSACGSNPTWNFCLPSAGSLPATTTLTLTE